MEEIKPPQQGFFKTGQVQESAWKTQSMSDKDEMTHWKFFSVDCFHF